MLIVFLGMKGPITIDLFVVNCNNVASKFKLQPRDYIYFESNTFEKAMNQLISPGTCLIVLSTIPLQRCFWH